MIDQHASADMDNRYIVTSLDTNIKASNKLIIHRQKHEAMQILISLYYLILFNKFNRIKT